MMADGGLVKFGILGCATIANKLCAAISAAPGASVYAVGSRSLEKAHNFANENGLPPGTKVYGSYQGVLDDEVVDAVYIPLPTSLHLEWAVKAAEKKKHILIEKPPALTTEELDEIIAACTKSGVQLMDGTMWMHHPCATTMKEALKKRELLGEIQEVHHTFFVPMEHHLPGFFSKDIRVKPDLDALGALGDLGWYCARGILWAYDYELPTSVLAMPGAKFNDEGVVMSCGAAMSWPDGRVATMHCAFYGSFTSKMMVYGTEGTLEVPDIFMGHYKVHGKGIFEDMDLGWNPSVKSFQVEADTTQESLMVQCFSSLVKHVKEGTGGVDPFWPTITRKTQQLLDAINLSLKQDCKAVVLQG